MKALVILIYSLGSLVLQGQGLTAFEISQNSMPGGDQVTYRFDGERLMVFVNGRRKERVRVSREDAASLDSIYVDHQINNMDSSYYRRGILDGVNHLFEFERNGNLKSIYLGNYYSESLDHFLTAVNQLLDERYRLISLGKGLLEASDTIILYAPYFFIDCDSIPEGFDTFHLLHLGRSELLNPTTDTLRQVLCLWEGVDEEGDLNWRRNIKADRRDSNTWHVVYYDEERNVYKREQYPETYPFEIVKEEVTVLEGVKPSVEITRYFRLEGFSD